VKNKFSSISVSATEVNAEQVKNRLRRKGSSIYKKDIDSDNKSELSDDSAGARIVRDNGKRSSLLRPNHTVGSSSHASAKGKKLEQPQIEIRGVETIEEFFRPEFAQNTQSLNDINDDSEEENEREGNTKLKR